MTSSARPIAAPCPTCGAELPGTLLACPSCGTLVHAGELTRLAGIAQEAERQGRFEMRGRSMQGWLRVDDEGVRTKRELVPWVKRGVAYARSLPPKG